MANLRRYSMGSASEVAVQAAHMIEALLNKHPATVAVTNVEDDPVYRAKDIDLLWQVNTANGQLKTVRIEVKGDRWHKSGNYFFETCSNTGKGTPGCFMYTEADYVYYLFVEERELHILPMPATRVWFTKHLSEFRERETSTPVGDGKFYVTVGRLVPRKRVLAEVPGAVVRHI